MALLGFALGVAAGGFIRFVLTPLMLRRVGGEVPATIALLVPAPFVGMTLGYFGARASKGATFAASFVATAVTAPLAGLTLGLARSIERASLETSEIARCVDMSLMGATIFSPILLGVALVVGAVLNRVREESALDTGAPAPSVAAVGHP